MLYKLKEYIKMGNQSTSLLKDLVKDPDNMIRGRVVTVCHMQKAREKMIDEGSKLTYMCKKPWSSLEPQEYICPVLNHRKWL